MFMSTEGKLAIALCAITAIYAFVTHDWFAFVGWGEAVIFGLAYEDQREQIV